MEELKKKIVTQKILVRVALDVHDKKDIKLFEKKVQEIFEDKVKYKKVTRLHYEFEVKFRTIRIIRIY
ncbi:hypothetical protein BFG57_09605 [Bacillus solimangrovi]|uniref:Uncharacterized protein n=1 Tax=Bacillus solimangrovi TaxID=1305675 RepID=A0A1E5LJ24_9BACI|nr:hypothetical protein BFG57_09605 [Bacillus solimangrovi]